MFCSRVVVGEEGGGDGLGALRDGGAAAAACRVARRVGLPRDVPGGHLDAVLDVAAGAQLLEAVGVPACAAGRQWGWGVGQGTGAGWQRRGLPAALPARLLPQRPAPAASSLRRQTLPRCLPRARARTVDDGLVADQLVGCHAGEAGDEVGAREHRDEVALQVAGEAAVWGQSGSVGVQRHSACASRQPRRQLHRGGSLCSARRAAQAPTLLANLSTIHEAEPLKVCWLPSSCDSATRVTPLTAWVGEPGGGGGEVSSRHQASGGGGGPCARARQSLPAAPRPDPPHPCRRRPRAGRPPPGPPCAR